MASDAAEVGKRLALPLSLGQQMAQQWRQGEAAYLQGMSLVFAQLRTERAVYPGHYAAVRNVYLVYLQRPGHDKQDKVCHILHVASHAKPLVWRHLIAYYGWHVWLAEVPQLLMLLNCMHESHQGILYTADGVCTCCTMRCHALLSTFF